MTTPHAAYPPPPPPPTHPQQGPTPPWTRSSTDRVVAGVCGGIGRRLDVDPVILRVVIVILSFFAGAGIVIYAAAWLFLQSDTNGQSVVEEALSGTTKDRTRSVLITTALVVVLAIASVTVFSRGVVPGLLVALAIFAVLLAVRRDPAGTRPPAPGYGGPYGGGPYDGPYGGGPYGGVPHGGPSGGSSYDTPAGSTAPYAAPPAQPTAPAAAPAPWTAAGTFSGGGSGTGASTAPEPTVVEPRPGDEPTTALATPGSDAAAGRHDDEPTTALTTYDDAGRPGDELTTALAVDRPEPTVSLPAYPLAGVTAVDREPATSAYEPRPPWEQWGQAGGPPYETPPPPPPPGPSGPTGSPPASKRERSYLGVLTTSVALVGVGVLAVVDQGGVDVATAAYVALPLAVVAVGLLVGTVFGRSRGLIALGLVLGLALAPAALADAAGFREWHDLGNADEVREAPRLVSELEPSYEFGAGSIRLDLTDLELEPGTATRIDLGAGEVRVIVPAEADVTVTTNVVAGEAVTFDRRSSGFDSGDTFTDYGPDGPGGGELELMIDLGVGSVEVRRAAA